MHRIIAQRWTRQALAAAGLLGAAAAWAENPPLYWSNQPDGVAVRQGYHIEWQRTAEEGGPGEMIIAWSDTRFGMRDLFAQKIDASNPGQPSVWSSNDPEHGGAVDAFIVNDDVIRQEDPVLISDGSGGAIISWIDFATDPRGDIRVNRLVDGSSGTGDFGAGWPDAGVVMCTACANGSENMAKSHCVDGAGGSWVAWTDRRGSTWDIYISHVTSAGAIPATFLPDGLLVVGEVGDQEALTMEHDGAGGAFIAWVDKRDAADDNIYIEHVLANGTLVHGGGGLPVVSLPGSQHSAKVTWDGGTGCFVSWVDLRADNAGDIYLQHYNSSLGPSFPTNGQAIASQLNNAEKNPRLSYAGDGNTLLMWEDNRNDPGNTQADVYCQKVSTVNTAIWGAGGVPVTLAAGNQQQARVLGDGSGGAFFVWQDSRAETYSSIYAQKLNASGVRQWSNDGAVVVDRADVEADAIAPSLRVDQQGGLFVAWGDLSRGSLGIFTQHLNAAGQQSFPAEGHDSVWGISGSCAKVKNLSQPDGTMVFWIDPRNANGPHVYVQKLARGTGQPLFPENGLPVDLGLDSQINYQVLADGSGGAYVLIESGSEFAQRAWLLRLDSNGQPVWDAARPVTPSFNPDSGLEYQERTRLIRSGSSIIVAWSGVDTDYSEFFAEVNAQAFDASGAILWGDAGMRVTSTPAIHEKLSDIAAGPNGGVYLFWDSGNWQDTNVLSQLLNAQGQIQFTAGGIPFANGLGKQEQAIAVPGDHGNVLGLWLDYAADFSNSDLIMRSMSSAGATEWTAQVDMRTQSQKTPVLVADEMGGAFVAYTDFSNGQNDDVYAQHVLSDGTLAWDSSEIPVGVGDGTQEDVAATLVPRAGWNGLVLAMAGEELGDTTGYKDLWARDSKVSQTTGDVIETLYEGNVLHFFHSQREPFLSYDQADGVYLSWVDMRASGKEDLKDIYTTRLATGDVEVAPTPGVVRAFQLAQNQPNPFNPSTRIDFQVYRPGQVALRIYDVAGHLVRTLQDGLLSTGTHHMVFDGRDAQGLPLASGVYIYRLTLDGESSARRMLMVK
jgi:hypothetical protein